VTLHSDTKCQAQVKCLFIGEPELTCELVDPYSFCQLLDQSSLATSQASTRRARSILPHHSAKRYRLQLSRSARPRLLRLLCPRHCHGGWPLLERLSDRDREAECLNRVSAERSTQRSGKRVAANRLDKAGLTSPAEPGASASERADGQALAIRSEGEPQQSAPVHRLPATDASPKNRRWARAQRRPRFHYLGRHPRPLPPSRRQSRHHERPPRSRRARHRPAHSR
jgi:hypothetical protein